MPPFPDDNVAVSLSILNISSVVLTVGFSILLPLWMTTPTRGQNSFTWLTPSAPQDASLPKNFSHATMRRHFPINHARLQLRNLILLLLFSMSLAGAQLQSYTNSTLPYWETLTFVATTSVFFTENVTFTVLYSVRIEFHNFFGF